MSKSVAVSIVSMKGMMFEGQAQFLVAHGAQGDVGITAGHAALLTQLLPGPVRVQHDGQEDVFYVSGGMMEVQPHRITILADNAVRAADLDAAAAEQAHRHAEQVLTEQRDDMNMSKALEHLARATAELRTLNQYKNRAGRG
ncbi:MAG: F0F1 ATP synthase subunit epsilon [Pseudomonadales bacterium]|nr:F0F1 ATP synthase subunit epsilon [Pseudomonadales bacterium]